MMFGDHEVQAYPWRLVYSRFEPSQERLREVLCTLGNGYLGTRGAAPESAVSDSKIHYPGTYIAGVFNKLATDIAGRSIYNDDMVNCSNWMFISFKIGDGSWFCPSTCRILSYRQELNMKDGVLLRKIRFQNYKGQRTVVETRTIAHMQNPHICAIEYKIIPENYSEIITVRTMLDGAVENNGVERYRQLNSKHLKANAIGRFSSNGVFLSMRTNQSRIEIAQAEKIKVFCDGNELKTRIRPITRRLLQGKARIGQEFRIMVQPGKTYSVEKCVTIYTSRDAGIKNPLAVAVDLAKNSLPFNFLAETHKKTWNDIWQKCDIQIDGDVFSQMAVRFHIYHLLQTASRHNINIDSAVPARGLHGEAYRGHIFWDEIFAFPFYSMHVPEVSKASFMYRYKRLNKAREYAKNNGYKGAMFPWQSSMTGEEETQELHLNPLSGRWGVDLSRRQRHVSFAIAYNIWQYYKITGDINFMRKFGIELFLSIAQFAASLTKYSILTGRYSTYGIMGPDEFHEKNPGTKKPGLKDNAYTNVMIVWVLCKAKELLDTLSVQNKEKLKKKLDITDKEIRRWEDVTEKMNIVIDDNNIISQFDGYFALKELDWKAYTAEYGNIKRMDRILKAEDKSPDEYKVAKQADTLMLFYLFNFSELRSIFSKLGYNLKDDSLRKNYDYYEKRTSHGSTLSKVVHGFLAHKLGRSKASWDWFQSVLQSDVYDTQGGTTPEGIHVGVMGGSIDIVLRRYLGVDVTGEIVKFAPQVPRSWKKITTKIRYRDFWITVWADTQQIKVIVDAFQNDPKTVLAVEINGKIHDLGMGKSYSFSLN
ncbi:MAG: glycosyl hydrolase family 65 protein [Candidatus Omnitrophica bacterium]|nr:glycosyl hydrolase family 65 protein [Candidatus Omnitrophota bacterium]